VCPYPISYDLHAYSPIIFSYWQSFDHNANSYPYYDILDAYYAIFNTVIETMNERHEYFAGKMRECAYYMRPTLVHLLLDLRLVSIMIMSLPFL